MSTQCTEVITYTLGLDKPVRMRCILNEGTHGVFHSYEQPVEPPNDTPAEPEPPDNINALD